MIRCVTSNLLAALLGACAQAPEATVSVTDSIRIATFNIQELGLAKLDRIDSVGNGLDTQLIAAATVIRRVRPDILLLNEVDFDAREPARLFAERYLRSGADGIDYPFHFTAPSNTGILSGADLDRNGLIADTSLRGSRAHGDDSWGFGVYPGQYAMAILSRFPIDPAAVRTFQLFRWRDLPGNHMPGGFWPDSIAERVRLSSKSHWDVPVVIGTDTLHLLASHPTPPVFDGPEDRNGRRNFDEIGFWKHYLDDSEALVDDRGVRGGLTPGAPFVILGDLNADPERADTAYDGVRAMAQLLGHPRVQDVPAHRGVPTASFLGGTRVDYALPSRGLEVLGAGVFDPDSTVDAPGASVARAASDHRMVWLDLHWPPR
jgi:endonuclease/exonuclease/phosphatase family metal-dependent hydrolase